MITGAAQGIGYAIAELFAGAGADLVLIDLKREVGKIGEGIAQASGRKVLALTGDLTVASELDRFVREALATFGKISILVNNAGVALLGPAEELSERDWDSTMMLNLKAPFLLSQRVAREMIARKIRGKIVNLASQASIVALERHVAYCASKAGIVGMTKVLALEWGKHGITVNSISPTVVLTELGEKVWAGEVGEEMKKKIPLGRFGQPNEIAAAALYLCSPAASLVTGSNLVIDGGYSVQ